MFQPLPFSIGLRYLRAKRRNGFISFISMASILGIIIGVIALITTIAVMSGFQQELRDRILESQALAEMHTALRELGYSLDAIVRDALATVTQAINDEVMGLLAGVFDELTEQLAPLKNFGQYLRSAGISGHSVIRGDRLSLLRLDGMAEINVQQIPITFNGFFEYRARAADGRIVWLHDLVRVVLGPRGIPAELRGVMFDVTSSKHEARSPAAALPTPSREELAAL